MLHVGRVLDAAFVAAFARNWSRSRAICRMQLSDVANSHMDQDVSLRPVFMVA